MSEDGVPASIGRRILSWYIDYLFFAVAWALLTYVVGSLIDIGGLLLSLIVFLILRGILGQFFVSPGSALLSIEPDGNVDRENRERESWLTLTLGVMILLSGTKELVRWTEIGQVWPFFGFVPDPVAHIVISLVLGLLSVLAGCLILKLQRAGQLLGIMLSLVYLASAILSWQLWDDVIARQVHARRAVQGLPVRAGEVEFIQSLFPEIVIGLCVVTILLLLVPTRRFS